MCQVNSGSLYMMEALIAKHANIKTCFMQQKNSSAGDDALTEQSIVRPTPLVIIGETWPLHGVR